MADSRKELPFDIFAEKTVLGLMINDSKTATAILSTLNLNDFYAGNFKNRSIFLAIKRINDRGDLVDLPSVISELVIMKELENVTEEYIYDLVEQTLETTNYEYYVNILKDYTLLRGFVSTIKDILGEYETKDIKNISDFVEKSDQKITEITKNRRISGFKKASEIASTVTEELINRVSGDYETLPGITSGFESLDRFTGGFKKGELIYLAARPSVGKTALALNLCYNAASKTHKPVAIFEMEMQAETLFKRLLASRSTVELDKINKGFLSKQDKLKIKEGAREIGQVPLYIDDSTSSTIDDIIAKSRKLKNELGDLGLIMVDYIGIISDSRFVNKNDSRQNIISSYSRKLKELAGELNVPVLVLSQLTRKVDERDNKKPQISDLRESGSLEQDADQVLLIYRPAYYTDQGISISGDKKFKTNKNEDMPLNEQQEQTVRTSDGGDIVHLSLAKNRNGPIGTVNLLFFKSYGRFTAPAKETEEIINNFQGDDF